MDISAKEVTALIKLGLKNGLKELKAGEIYIKFGDPVDKMGVKKLNKKELAALRDIKEEAFIDEMRIMDPAAYEESLAIGDIA